MHLEYNLSISKPDNLFLYGFHADCGLQSCCHTEPQHAYGKEGTLHHYLAKKQTLNSNYSYDYIQAILEEWIE